MPHSLISSLFIPVYSEAQIASAISRHHHRNPISHLLYCNFCFIRCLYYFSDSDVQFLYNSLCEPFSTADTWLYDD